MTAREQLWYLINGVLNGSYEVSTFCDEFYRIYNFETDKTNLTEQEKREFEELFRMAARFSDFEEDLKIPGVFYTGEEILAKVKEVQKLKCWKAHFKDAQHDANIEITNIVVPSCEEKPIRFEVDGIRFCASDIGCIYLADETQYQEAAEKFHILKLGGNTVDGRKLPYWYELQRYELAVEIPIQMVRKKDKEEMEGTLYMSYKYVKSENKKSGCRYMCDDAEVSHDKAEVADFVIFVEGKNYHSDEKTLVFWKALNNLSAKMKEEYFIKSCFTCQYAEYSPYGEDCYGTMLCYKDCKKECLKVHNKNDYFEYLDGKDGDVRQETYVCEEYQIRNISCGYRGFVEGVN